MRARVAALGCRGPFDADVDVGAAAAR